MNRMVSASDTSAPKTQSKLTLSELEQHLWGAANILRGPIDQADFKSYIFPLLFFKRICDVYDEAYADALQESDGDIAYAAFAENHRFQTPAGAHWDDVREKPENLGLALQNAMRAIETANPETLYGTGAASRTCEANALSQKGSWEIGPELRGRGSVQSDRCRLPAAALAGNRFLAVFPTLGWWEGRGDRAEAAIAYGLVVTIDAGEVPIDSYALIRGANRGGGARGLRRIGDETAR